MIVMIFSCGYLRLKQRARTGRHLNCPDSDADQNNSMFIEAGDQGGGNASETLKRDNDL